ncbi:MAG: peptide ABC transporter permease [Candidatus Schekmanbacteria bacterium RBG_16_38_11]|uniref:Peptide ABC transporter permease n=1 Tax=Candidatus Schekmanbacteria bacterium RBG_16_38_11 TaxID=1817880 RepID=A0A1F7RYE1_9BACT|nr:MAG: peptide ABC transporter permease [Candidatus Schekmanbacteria bacterium RBG_16_38_11]
MIKLIFRRFLWGIPVLFFVASLTFSLMHVVPGGPFDKEKNLPPAIQKNIEEKYHLDKPVITQYLLYMLSLSKGDLGPSYKYLGRNVNDIISQTFPVSLELGLWAFVIAIILGISTGIISAVRVNTLIDRVSQFVATAGISMPNFVLAVLLILIFSEYLKALPAALWESSRYAILPSLTLSLGPAAYISRLTRGSIIDVLGKDYIKTARAKGLSEPLILFKHVIRNSISPIITILGPLGATLVTGSFIVEYIFSIPGMGKFFITAVTNRDYPLIMGITLIYSALIIIANIFVDILYSVIDPRVRMK